MNNREKPYFVISIGDFINDYPDLAKTEGFSLTGGNYSSVILKDSSEFVEFIGCDEMEPEDATFGRDLSWVVRELNKK